jgi:hypothetical protein
MEVHHPHHPTHKKKWSEYIIEFVMLFTAVTLGFFAENIREHLAENEKKKELLTAVIRNFKTDKEEIERHRVMVKRRIANCERFSNLLQMDYKNVNKIEFYRSAVWYAENKDLVLNEKTRNDAEAKGYFTNDDKGELSGILNKYNYYYNDYKEMNLGVLESCKRYINTTISNVLDSKLIEHSNFVWFENASSDDPRFKGNLTAPVNPKVVENIIYDSWFRKILLQGELSVFDSLDLYANKAIAKLQTENKEEK